MTDTPADLITAAAKHIREAANSASPAPWLTTNENTPWLADKTVFGQSMHMANRISQVCSTDYGQNRLPDAAYIALMHPGVAVAVADWLVDATDGGIDGECNPYALAVARAVLSQDGQQ